MSNNIGIDNRRDRQKRLALQAGWLNWYEFETAVIRGQVDLPRKDTSRRASKTVVKSKRTKGANHA